MHVLSITFASPFIFVIQCACVFLTLSQLTINLYWLENHLGRTAEVKTLMAVNYIRIRISLERVFFIDDYLPAHFLNGRRYVQNG